MEDRSREQLNFKRLMNTKPKPLDLSKKGLVDISLLRPDLSLPLVIQPAVRDVDPAQWALNNREFIESKLLSHAAILFRGFAVASISDFATFITAISPELVDYADPSTPRSEVGEKVYTSTEYPDEQSIELHNEMSYSRSWPMKVGFFCVTPPQSGGETPIADSRRVLRRIAPEISAEFVEKKIMYVRNYGRILGLPWQTVFKTTIREEVEARCREANIEFAWHGDQLRTRYICQPTALHPRTGEEVWFNQAHLHHLSALDPAVRESLLSTVSEDDLPFNTLFGDGSPIDPTLLAHVRESYREETVSFAWREGDILLLDNMLAAHGRAPFVGPRKIAVAMSETFHPQVR
jgi:Taurine catabolism dioxygenase TauD, TfdA family.